MSRVKVQQRAGIKARRVGTTLSLFGLGKGTHRENVVSFNAHTSPQRSERDSKMVASHSGLY